MTEQQGSSSEVLPAKVAFHHGILTRDEAERLRDQPEALLQAASLGSHLSQVAIRQQDPGSTAATHCHLICFVETVPETGERSSDCFLICH